MVERLTGAARHTALRELHGWSEVEDRDAIRKSYHFSNFSEAWGFLSRIALVAEKMDHHPEIFNVYNRVEIILSTHDVDGVSDKDVHLAQAIDELAQALPVHIGHFADHDAYAFHGLRMREEVVELIERAFAPRFA